MPFRFFGQRIIGGDASGRIFCLLHLAFIKAWPAEMKKQGQSDFFFLFL